MSKKMTMLEHLDELRKRLTYCMITVAVIAAFTFAFGLRQTVINGYMVYYPYPDTIHNIPSQLLEFLKISVLPEGVKLIVTEAGEAFYAVFYISIFLGILIGIPVIAYQLARFIVPGLYPHEKRMIGKMVVPSVGLFLTGCIFAYFVVIPWVLNFLYSYGFALGAETYLTIDGFVSFILMFMLAFGAAFQLPLVMIALSMLGIVDARFWRENIRYAVMAMAVFGAVITPDGSGISMFFVAGPMILLYAVGYFVAARTKAKIK